MGRTTQSRAMVCQVTIHVLKRQLTLTGSVDLQAAIPQGPPPRSLISLAEGTGAANTRAGRVVRVNVSPDFGDVTH